MIEKLQELKANFATHIQTVGKLVKYTTDGYCLCAEGILAISAGAKIVPSKVRKNTNLYIEDRYFSLYIPLNIYAKLGLPMSIEKEKILEWKKQLELTTEQIYLLDINISNKYSWSVLNDHIQFNFHQFSLLLDLLDTNP
jgi:hypothetical protein